MILPSQERARDFSRFTNKVFHGVHEWFVECSEFNARFVKKPCGDPTKIPFSAHVRADTENYV
jgi:hypothetical protein